LMGAGCHRQDPEEVRQRWHSLSAPEQLEGDR
jgi:hypothetical protein